VADYIRWFPIVYRSRSLPLGNAGFVEMVAESAPAPTLRAIADGSADVFAYINHDTSKPFGRIRNRTLSLRSVPGKGVYATAEIDPHVSYATDALHAWRRGDLRGGSFGFRCDRDEWWVEGSTPVRLIQSMTFTDVTLTTTPAYPATEFAACRRETGAAAESRSDRALADRVAARVLRLAREYPDRELRFGCDYRDGEEHLSIRSAARRGAYRPSVAMRRRELAVEQIAEEVSAYARTR